MSWHIKYCGKLQDVIRAVENHPTYDMGQAAEFGLAKPHLISLLAINTYPNCAISIEASGGKIVEGTKIYDACSVTITEIRGLV